MSGFLIDTNVFSEVFAKNQNIIDFIETLDAYIDTTIYIECLQGSKSNSEKRLIRNLLDTFGLLPLTETVSAKAIELIDRYSNSYGLLLPDALIASSSINANLTLVTYNIDDFKFIDGLKFKRPLF